MPNLTPDQAGRQPIEYASDYLRNGSYGDDEKLRSLTGEGGFVHDSRSSYRGVEEAYEKFVDYWPNSLARQGVVLHDGIERHGPKEEELPDTGQPPRVIFMTATRAIPFGIAIKAFWKERYPNEKPPAFKVVDSSSQRFTRITSEETRARVEEAEVKRLREAGEQFGYENIAILDEFANSGSTLRDAGRLLETAGFKDVNYIHGKFGDPYASMLPDAELPLVREEGSHFDGGTEYRRLLWNGGVKSRALAKDMKMVGHLMVEQARQHDLDSSETHYLSYSIDASKGWDLPEVLSL